jgi:PKD repeat protein
MIYECWWEDSTAPYVLGYSHSSHPGTDIRIYFSEPIDTSTLVGRVHVSGSSSGSVAFDGSYNPADDSYIIIPYSDFAYGEVVYVSVEREVRDLAGNCLEGAYSFSFSIQDDPGGTPTAIQITSMSLSPSTVEPYGTVVVSGFAQYDTGAPVDVATATISVSGGSTWTAAVVNGSFSRPIQAPGNPSGWPITRTVTATVDDGEVTPDSESRTLTILGIDDPNGYDFDRATSCVDVQDEPPYAPIDEKPVFSERDPQITIWVHLEYLHVPVKVRWQWYDPDGNLFATRYSDWTDDPQNYGYLYWYDWWFGWPWTGLCDYEGLWSCEVAVRPEGGSYETMDTVEFTVRYDFTEHQMCANVEGPPDYDPIDPRNVFYTDDTIAYTWAKFINVADPLELKWVYHSPQGQYSEFTDTTDDPWAQGYDWWGWQKAWGGIYIDGYSAEYQCGDWHVDVYVKDCYGNYELKYTDAFQLLEHPAIVPSPSVTATPDPVIETQQVQLNVSATDNNHLKKVVLHWDDGSGHSHTMADNINNGSYSGSYTIGPFASGQQIQYWCEAWDESGNRGESTHRTIIVQPETVTVPSQPSGPAFLGVGEAGSYATGGSTTNLGNPVQYQFNWGDGGTSPWGGSTRSASWAEEGFFAVRSRARSQVHPSRMSGWSSPMVVTVDSTGPAVEITTNGGMDFETTDSHVLLEGTATDALAGVDTVMISSGETNQGTPQVWAFTVSLVPGPNPLTITAVDYAGNSATDIITVTYSDAAPDAQFSATPHSGPVPLTVQFTDESTGGITSWEWDFDNDGSTDSMEQNPDWTYQNPGTYSVKLTVTGPGGNDSETKWDYITVDCVLPDPPAWLTASQGTRCWEIELSWAPVSGAVHYEIFRNSENSPPAAPHVVTDGDETTYVDDVPAGGQFWYWVSAVDSCGASDHSEPAIGDAAVSPGSFDLSVPSNGATCLPADTCLSWEPAADAVVYAVFWGTSDPPPFWTSTTDTSACPPGQQSGTDYYWYVDAMNDCGHSFTGVRFYSVDDTAPPTDAHAVPPEVCAGGEVVLEASGNGAIVEWYADGCGETLIGVGEAIFITVSSDETYFARAVDPNTGCSSETCTSVDVTVFPLPPTPVNMQATPSVACFGHPVTLSASAPDGGIVWFEGVCGWPEIGVGGSIEVMPTEETTYFARAVDTATNCESAECVSVTVPIHERTFADFDCDLEITAYDASEFLPCLSGPGLPIDTYCEISDSDADTDCDLRDIAQLQVLVTGGEVDCNGNGIPDPLEAEWRLAENWGPSARELHAVAYDSTRDVTVLFGGRENGVRNGETWEWNGAQWALRSTAGPSPRYGHAMAYDRDRGVVVLFGGRSVAGLEGDTWEWDGYEWTLRATDGPASRYRHAMCYDSLRHETILHGAYGGGADETWAWNGSSWVLRDVGGAGTRRSHAMVFDGARGVAVMFGGRDDDDEYVDDTWEWDGSAWSSRTTAGPSNRRDHAMAYDTANGVTVLFGGWDVDYCADAWAWDGETWTELTQPAPMPRLFHGMTYDDARDATVLFGGTTNAGHSAETWERKVAPEILIHPVDASVGIGDVVEFQVEAAGAGNLTYQWRKNGGALVDDDRISGATTPTLTIAMVAAGDSGMYDVLVTDACGRTCSLAAALSVAVP